VLQPLPTSPNNHLTHSELLGLLVSHLDEFVVVLCDVQGRFTSWHPGVLATFGYTEEEFLGKNLELLYLPADREDGSVRAEIERARERGRALETRWLVRKSGEKLMVEGVTVTLKNAAGQDVGFGKILRDVTAQFALRQELQSANERLKRMADELERSNGELEEFARIASHDLSAPITSTRWLVDLLSSRHGKHLDAEGAKCLKQISMSLERMSDLVEAVLTHAKVGTSAIGAAENADAAEALEVALDNLGRDIATSGAVIEYGKLPALPIQPLPLSQLFQNLLSNAIKYRRPNTTAQVKVTAERQGLVWVVGVHDNGIGVEPEWFERIFLPMQRRHGAEVAGSGIGLATCKKIVARAGGRIWVESEEGLGSSFFFTLPADD
jgi:PAS domain S-box-containing protein